MIPFTVWTNKAKSWVYQYADGPVCVLIETQSKRHICRMLVSNPKTGERRPIEYLYHPSVDLDAEPTAYFFVSRTHIKVGCSIDVPGRFYELTHHKTQIKRPDQYHSYRLKVLGTIAGGSGYQRETQAKRLLKDYHDVGEWFHKCKKSIALVRSIPDFRESHYFVDKLNRIIL